MTAVDLVAEIAQPIVSRVIGSFMGIPEEDDAIWAKLMNATLGANDPDLNPGGLEEIKGDLIPAIFDRCRAMIAARREHPTDDLTSVLVHAEIEGQRLDENEIVMGFFLLVAAGNDSTKATYASGMQALMADDEQRATGPRRPIAAARRRRGVAADVPRVRALPAHRDAGRRARRAADPQGRQGRPRYVASNRDERRYDDPDHFDVRRTTEHQAFGAGGRHFCLGTALARLELRIMFEETLARFPRIALDHDADSSRRDRGRRYVESAFINQLKTLPVVLRRA